MIRLTSRLLFSFVWVFILQEVTVAIECKPGQMATIDGKKCVPCPADQYNPYSGDVIECRNCVPCDEYSAVISACTPTSNTKCRCLKGFTPLDKDEEECRCEKGSGIEKEGNKMVCKECPPGTFTSRSNSKCQPWKKCDENGVKTPGSHVSDVVCRNASTDIQKIVTALPVTPSVGPSANAPTVAKTTTKLSKSSVSVSHVTPSIESPTIRQHGLWLAPLGCVLALLLIQLVIMKMKFTSCFLKNKTVMVRKDSECTKPVEESGEKFIPSAV